MSQSRRNFTVRYALRSAQESPWKNMLTPGTLIILRTLIAKFSELSYTIHVRVQLLKWWGVLFFFMSRPSLLHLLSICVVCWISPKDTARSFSVSPTFTGRDIQRSTVPSSPNMRRTKSTSESSMRIPNSSNIADNGLGATTQSTLRDAGACSQMIFGTVRLRRTKTVPECIGSRQFRIKYERPADDQ